MLSGIKILKKVGKRDNNIFLFNIFFLNIYKYVFKIENRISTYQDLIWFLINSVRISTLLYQIIAHINDDYYFFYKIFNIFLEKTK